jgi:hypothetical protein
VQAGRIKGVQVAGKQNGCGWAGVQNGTGGRHRVGAGGMNVEWVQVAGTWNGCRWQARGMDAGGWVAVCRAGVSVENKRGSEGVVGRVRVQAQRIKGGPYGHVEWVWVHT